MTRKTIKVDELKARANYVLLNSSDDARGERLGWLTMIQGVLHDTGNYKGFKYLNARDMLESIEGVSVGINAVDLPYDERFAGTDDSRVRYY